MIKFTHVDGVDKGKVVLYALSTCVWCKKTKKLLDQMGVSYDFLYVDLLEDKEGDKFEAEVVKKWNPDCTYPTLVINDKKCIVNFKEKEIRAALG